jgi:hypothetical protein
VEQTGMTLNGTTLIENYPIALATRNLHYKSSYIHIGMYDLDNYRYYLEQSIRYKI